MAEKKELVKDRLQRLIARMKKFGYSDYMIKRAQERIDELQQRDVRGVDKFVQKLLDRIGNKEAYLDILMEGHFAIILARNGFTNIHIEYTPKGPDLKAVWNTDPIYFEITRRHSEIDEWAEHTEAYEMGLDKVETAIDKIQGKVKQLLDGETNIVVYCSDTMNSLSQNVEGAFGYIQQEIKVDPQKYKDLSGVLFTDWFVDPATFKQFYLFKTEGASKPLKPSLIEKLEFLLERDKGEP